MFLYVLKEKHILKIFVESIKYWLSHIADLHADSLENGSHVNLSVSLGGTAEQLWQFSYSSKATFLII